MPIQITTRRRTLAPGRYDWAAWITGDCSKYHIDRSERRAIEGLAKYFANPPPEFVVVKGKLKRKEKAK